MLTDDKDDKDSVQADDGSTRNLNVLDDGVEVVLNVCGILKLNIEPTSGLVSLLSATPVA